MEMEGEREETDRNLRVRDVEYTLPPGWSALRVLEPDGSMDALDEEALAWLRDRADECAAALAPFARHEAGELPALAVRTVRTMGDAVHAWSYGEPRFDPGRRASRVRDPSELEVWNRVLHRAGEFPEDTPAIRWLSALAAAVCELDATGDTLRAVWSAMRGPARHVAERSPLVRATLASWADGFPWQSTLACDALWRARFGARPSPWEPWLRVWERGAWPLFGRGPSLVVYVPLRSGDQLAQETLFPRRDRVPVTLAPLGAAGPGLDSPFGLPCEVFTQVHPLGLPFPPASIPVRARRSDVVVGPLAPPESSGEPR